MYSMWGVFEISALRFLLPTEYKGGKLNFMCGGQTVEKMTLLSIIVEVSLLSF